MASLQGIGSVVAIGGRRFVVAGHRMTRDGDSVGPGYVVVPYPLGFVEAKSIMVVPARAVEAVVAEGYAADAGSAYLAEVEALADANADVPYEAYDYNMALLQGLAGEEDADDE